MALIKTDGSIENIKGKLGGQYFSRDKSGLHICSMPRIVKYTRSDDQIDQNWWYAMKKHAEHVPYPDFPNPDEEIPPGTHVVYSLEVIWSHRQPALFAPTLTNVEYVGFWQNEITNWINNNWIPNYGTWGLTKDLMFLLMCKWFAVAKGTWGFGGAVAFAAAKANMVKWISLAAGAVAVPLLALWAGLAALSLYYAFIAWFEGQSGHVSFTKGRVLIRKDNTIWWGGLVRRPSKAMYDFAICGEAPFDGTIRAVTPVGHPYKINWFYPVEVWQTTTVGLIFFYVYTWQTVRARLRGKGFQITNNRLRMNVAPSQIDYWGKEIGWEISNSEACSYLLDFDDHFQYPGHPADPL